MKLEFDPEEFLATLSQARFKDISSEREDGEYILASLIEFCRPKPTYQVLYKLKGDPLYRLSEGAYYTSVTKFKEEWNNATFDVIKLFEVPVNEI